MRTCLRWYQRQSLASTALTSSGVPTSEGGSPHPKVVVALCRAPPFAALQDLGSLFDRKTLGFEGGTAIIDF